MTQSTARLNWYKSSYSSTQTNCVEVAHRMAWSHVRDSKLGDASPVLSFGDNAWAGFLMCARATVD